MLGFIKIFKISLEFISSSKKHKSRDCVIELDYSGQKIRWQLKCCDCSTWCTMVSFSK